MWKSTRQIIIESELNFYKPRVKNKRTFPEIVRKVGENDYQQSQFHMTIKHSYIRMFDIFVSYKKVFWRFQEFMRTGGKWLSTIPISHNSKTFIIINNDNFFQKRVIFQKLWDNLWKKLLSTIPISHDPKSPFTRLLTICFKKS